MRTMSQKITEFLACRKVDGLEDKPRDEEYHYPSLDMLNDYTQKVSPSKLEPKILESKLAEFGFVGKVEDIKVGPVVSRYEIKFGPGVRLSQIRNISEDLAVSLMSNRVRIIAPIPGTSLVGIEIKNEVPATIGLKGVLKGYEGNLVLPMALGTDTTGAPALFDLTTMPHMLVAGQTGSGKSVGLGAIIMTLLFTKRPDECKLVLVDPKRVEMTAYRGIPHLLAPVVNEPEDALDMFRDLVSTMEERYRILEGYGVRNIKSYNQLPGVERLPYIVVVVDEMSDLMMTSGKELEHVIVRLAQLSRAVGIHLVMATQKPIVKVITGLIKSNVPSRISFLVTSKLDSRVILDDNGAENLLGRGDMLVSHPGSSDPERFHGAWISDEEIIRVTNFLRR